MMRKWTPWLFGFGIIFFLSFVIFKLYIGGWVPFFTLALGLSAFFFILGMISCRKELIGFLSLKTTRHGIQNGLVIFIGIIGFLAVNGASFRFHKSIDLTRAEVNSLAPATLSMLKSLNKPLQFLFFYQKGVEGNEENRQQFRDLIRKYQDQSSFVQLNFIEVNDQPDLAKKYGVDEGSGVAFTEYLGRKSRIDKITEQDVTNSIVRTTLEKDLKIYTTSGHSERDWNQAKEPPGLNSLKLLLLNNRMQVLETRLAESGKVPTDCDVLMIVGPRTDFSQIELDALRAYLQRGGSIFVALENEDTPHLYQWLKDYGIRIQPQLIMNIVEVAGTQGVKEGPTFGSQFSQISSVTKLMSVNDAVSMLHPMSLEFSNVPEKMSYEALIQTSPSAIAFADLKMEKQLKVDSFNLAAEIEGPGAGEKSFRMIVVTDADFLANQMLFQNLNREFVMGSLASLTGLQQLVSIVQKIPEMTPLLLTPTKLTSLVLLIYLPIPLIMLGFGFYFFNQRRKS